MFFIKVKQDRKHRGASRHVGGKPAVAGTVDLLGKSVFPQALTGEIGPTARQPSSGQPCQARKVEGIELVEQVTLPGFFGFAEGRQDLTNESLLIQAVFPRPKRFAQVRSQPRQESLIHLKTRFLGFHQKTRSVTSRPEVRILSSRPIRQTARIRLHQLQPPDSRPHGLLRKISLSPIKQSGSVKHGHGLARGLLRATIRKAEEFVEGRNQLGHRGRGNRYGSEQTVGKKAFRRGKSHLLPGFQNKGLVFGVKRGGGTDRKGSFGQGCFTLAGSPDGNKDPSHLTLRFEFKPGSHGRAGGNGDGTLGIVQQANRTLGLKNRFHDPVFFG